MTNAAPSAVEIIISTDVESAAPQPSFADFAVSAAVAVTVVAVAVAVAVTVVAVAVAVDLAAVVVAVVSGGLI